MNRSKIEDDIAELESYIDNCKNAPLSSTKIICEREQLEYIIGQLKKNLPKEIEYCRDVMSRSEAIEREARERADRLVKDATNKTYELLSENEINQQAIRRADEIVKQAAIEGQAIYDSYIKEGDAYRESSQQYLNDMLMELQEMIYSCIDNTTRNTNKFLDALNKVGNTVTENLNELNNVPNNAGDEGGNAETALADLDLNS